MFGGGPSIALANADQLCKTFRRGFTVTGTQHWRPVCSRERPVLFSSPWLSQFVSQ